MKLARLGSKYLVSRGNRAQAVMPIFLVSSASRHRKLTPCSPFFIPRCLSYHSYIFCGSLVLKKTPPRPVTLRIQSSFSGRCFRQVECAAELKHLQS